MYWFPVSRGCGQKSKRRGMPNRTQIRRVLRLWMRWKIYFWLKLVALFSSLQAARL